MTLITSICLHAAHATAIKCRIFISLVVQFLSKQISVGVIIFTAIVWDTIYSSIQIMSHPPEYESRRSKRSKLSSNLRLRFYPSKWLLLSTVMIPCSRQLHPGTLCGNSILATVKRMDRMHDLVNCSPGVLWQYNTIRGGEIFHLFPKVVDIYDRAIFYDAVEPINYPTEEPHFFPAVSTLTDLGGGNEVDDFGTYFLDPCSTLSDLSMSTMSLDFHDCPCLEDDSSLFTNWMDLDIFNDITYLDCSQGSLISTAHLLLTVLLL